MAMGRTRSKASVILGKRLKQWRERTRTPLKTLAPELGVSVATVSDWERGMRFPTSEHLDIISQKTGIPHSCLFCEAPAGERRADCYSTPGT